MIHRSPRRGVYTPCSESFKGLLPSMIHRSPCKGVYTWLWVRLLMTRHYATTISEARREEGYMHVADSFAVKHKGKTEQNRKNTENEDKYVEI